MLKSFGTKVLGFEQNHVEKAAQLKADYGFRTADSIQLAITIEDQVPTYCLEGEKAERVNTLVKEGIKYHQEGETEVISFF